MTVGPSSSVVHQLVTASHGCWHFVTLLLLSLSPFSSTSLGVMAGWVGCPSPQHRLATCTAGKCKRAITWKTRHTDDTDLLGRRKSGFVADGKSRRRRTTVRRDWLRKMTVSSETDVSTASSTADEQNAVATSSPPRLVLLTNAVLNITYDGTHFQGFTAPNDPLSSNLTCNDDNDEGQGEDDEQPTAEPSPNNKNDGESDAFLPPLPSFATKGRRRRRVARIPGLAKAKVRSVEGVLKAHLAKLYGNVDLKRVVVEGSSRTDRGVHARGMIVSIYCLTEEAAIVAMSDDEEGGGNEFASEMVKDKKKSGVADENAKDDFCSAASVIPGKRLPHPSSSTDTTSFVPLPFHSDLNKIVFCLNRMFPPDVRAVGISPTPERSSSSSQSTTSKEDDGAEEEANRRRPFHPSIDAEWKTYQYTFSTGSDCHDPLRWRHVWHLDGYNGGGMTFDLKLAREASEALMGRHSFNAFRGTTRKKSKDVDTTCTIAEIRIENEHDKEEGGDSAVAERVDGLTRPIDDYVVGGERWIGEKKSKLETYTVTVTGDRFLYKMVRFLVGAIVEVGMGKLDVADVREALKSGTWKLEQEEEDDELGGTEEKIVLSMGKRRRKLRPVCAPAHGLMLKGVKYGEGIEFEWMDGRRKLYQ